MTEIDDSGDENYSEEVVSKVDICSVKPVTTSCNTLSVRRYVSARIVSISVVFKPTRINFFKYKSTLFFGIIAFQNSTVMALP